MTFPEASDANSQFQEAAIDRRRVIGGLGLAGLGLLATGTAASAATSGATPKVTVASQTRSQASPKNDRIDLTDLNPEWARKQGSVLPEYTRYLWNLKLKAISPAQVI